MAKSHLMTESLLGGGRLWKIPWGNAAGIVRELLGEGRQRGMTRLSSAGVLESKVMWLTSEARPVSGTRQHWLSTQGVTVL
jgi:hypothetical protein